MSWTNEDVRDEIYEQDEEEDEGPSWVDDKGKILEAAFCEYFLAKHPLMCLKQTLFDLDGEVDDLPESAFFMAGDLEDVRAHALQMVN